MLKELVEFLMGSGSRQAKPHVIDLDARTQLLAFEGEWKERKIPATPRAHEIVTIRSLFAAIATMTEVPCVVFHSSKEICCLLDDEGDRKDIVRVPLTLSDPFQAIQALPKPRQQKEFVFFLRRHYADCLPDGFLDTIRSIQFSRSEQGKAQIQHGKESLGRAVECEVESSVAAVPETISMNMPVYANRDVPFYATMKFHVMIDVETQLFALETYADEQDRVMFAADEAIHVLLQDGLKDLTYVTVLSGKP